jgi:hypothetical protein
MLIVKNPILKILKNKLSVDYKKTSELSGFDRLISLFPNAMLHQIVLKQIKIFVKQSNIIFWYYSPAQWLFDIYNSNTITQKFASCLQVF